MRQDDKTPRRPPASRQRFDWRQSPWLRRLYIAVLAVLTLGVVSRLVVVIALPPVIQLVAHHYKLAANYEQTELYLLSGDVGIWHFSLTPIEGGAPLVQSDYTRVHISTLDLLRGRLTIRRLEAEGVALQVDRTADGTIPLLQRFAQWTTHRNPSAPLASPNETAATPQSVDLSSPLEVDAFRLTNVHAHILDEAVRPPLDAQIDVNLRLTDLDSSERPTHFVMDMTGAPILDILHVEGTGRSNGKSLDTVLQFAAKGLHPQSAAGYLRHMGIHPTSSDIALAMTARITTAASEANPEAIAARVELTNMTVTADEQQVAALDKVSVSADDLSYTTAHVTQIAVNGGRCQMQRDAAHETGVAGLQVIEPAVLIERLEVPLSAALALIPQRWHVGEVLLSDLKLNFHDQALAPAADLTANLDELRLGSFSPNKPNDTTRIHALLTAPGVTGNINIDGAILPFAATKNLDMTLSVDGIQPDALRPYLDDLGLESDYNGGTFTAAFHADVRPGPGGTLATNAKLSKLALRNGGDLLVFDSVGLTGAAYDPAEGRLHIKSIDISGPQLATGRAVGGGLAALGFHAKPSQPQATPIVPPGIGPAMAAAQPERVREYIFSVPKLQIDKFLWKTVGVRFDDLSVTPNAALAIADAGVELDNLNIDFDPNDSADQPGKLHAWLNAPNLAQSIVVDGAIHRKANEMSADLSVDGTGVTSAAIARYFQNSRIQPALGAGTFHFLAKLGAAKTSDGVHASAGISELAYKDGENDLLTVDSASAGGIALRNNELSVEQVAVHSPKLWITRQADGSLIAAGIRITPPNRPAPPPDRLAQIYQSPPSLAAGGSSNAAASEFAATLHDFDLEDASLQWNDLAIQPAASAHLTASAGLQDVVLGKSAPPAKLEATVHEDQSLEQMTLTGLVTPSLQSPAAKLTVDARGIRAGGLGGYLGPNMRVILQDGRFHADLDVAVSQNPDGGVGAHLLVNGLDYRDGPDGPALCQLDAVRLLASRVDLSGKRIAIDEIGVDGLKTSAALCKDGTIRLLGVKLSSLPSSAAITAIAAPQAQAKAVGIANLAAVANEIHPLTTVDKLDIGVSAIAISDEFRPDAVPLTLSDIQITNRTRIELLGENPQTRPPFDLDVAGAINPLVGKMEVTARLSPFADPAQANIDVHLAAIRGSGVTDLLPDLKSQLDGSLLPDGRLTAQLSLQLKQPRSDPAELNLFHDFGVDFTLTGVQFTDGATGQPLAALGAAVAEDIAVQPANSTVVVHDIELTTPSARAWRDERGIHLLGLVIKPSAWQSVAADDAAIPAAALSDPISAQQATTTEIAINKLLVSGLDFGFEDRTCDPPLIVPLNGLDVEVRGLSTRMADEDAPCRFSVLLNAGKVPLPLPPRVHGSDSAATTRDTQSGVEERDLFSQAEANGIVSLYPQPKGWVKGSINALDLAALTGEARQAGVSLGGGTFDGTVDLRLSGDGSMDLGSRLSLTDLELSEPAHGPITHYLNIGSPLNVVIAALEDQDGSITIPIDVPIRSGHISSGDITLAATGAVASVITTAVASTPLKASDTVLSLFGNQKLPRNEQPVTLDFSPADPSLNIADLEKLQTLLKQAQNDPTLELALHHVLGGGDVTRAAVLANPSQPDSRNLADSLRLKRIVLVAARNAAAQRAAAQIASGFGADSNAAIQQVREIDVALAKTENAMDEMYDMLRPGAESQKGRRTRAACLEIGQDRLLAARDALLASGIPGIEQQIKVTHATFNAAGGDSGGQVIIVLTHKKNQ